MNEGLREGKMSAKVQNMVDNAREALKRLPLYSQPVDLDRGTVLPRWLINDMWRNRIFLDKAFVSATRDPLFADRMLQRAIRRRSDDEVPVYFTIKGSTVPTIESLSAYRGQAEHVFLPETKFKILDMVQDEFHGLKGWRVIMEEIEGQ